MGLIVPGVGTEPGPTWASDLNSDLGILDQHNHAAGQGVQITPAGININSDLSMNGNNLTTIKTVNFSAQGASLPGSAPNLGCIYVAGNELYYNDEAGNVVPITNNGNVNAGAGSITGLPSGTASASYSAGSQTFVWQSATSTPANMDFASATFRNLIASSKGLTVNPPNAMASDYSLTLPPSNATGTTVYLQYDSSNNIVSGVKANAKFFASAQVTTDSTAIPGGTFINFDNSPSFSFTPSFTGTYKVYCSIPFAAAAASNPNGAARIFNTSGGATLLYESQIQVFTTTTVIATGLAQSVYTLTSGNTYVFDIQGKLYTGTVGIYAAGNASPFYMFAEFVS